MLSIQPTDTKQCFLTRRARLLSRRRGRGFAVSPALVGAAFIFPTTKADTEYIKRQCDCNPHNGSQVRRGHGCSLVVLPALLSGARGTWLARFTSAQQSGNPATGGAQTAPGSAAAYSLTAQAAPALPLSHDNRTIANDNEEILHASGNLGDSSLILHAVLARHNGEPAAQLDGLLQAIYSAPSGGAQQCGNPEGYRRPLHRKARRLPLIPNCYTRGRPCVGLRWAAGSEQPRALVRGKTRGKSLMARQTYLQLRRAIPPRDRTGGGHCGREDTRQARQRAHPENANALARRAPETGYFSMTATNERTT